MTMFDRAPYMKAKYSLRPLIRKGAANGEAVVDMKGYESAVVYVVTGTWTDGSCTIEVKDSPDNVTSTAVEHKYLAGAEATSDAAGESNGVCYRIGYKGPNRYLRVDTSAGSGTTGQILGAIVVLGDAYSKPVTQD